MLFLLCLFHIILSQNITLPKRFDILHGKYLMYEWDINACGNPAAFVINKNNQTFLTVQIESCDYQCGQRVSMPSCVFIYNPTDIYEWYIIDACNITINRSTFKTYAFDTYYVTNSINLYNPVVYHKKYILIDIPHYTNSLELSCLESSIKTTIYDSRQPAFSKNV